MVERAVVVFVVVWAVTLVWFEFLIYATWSCPGVASASARTTTVAVIADPQLTDYYSYRWLNEGLLLTITEFYCDLFLRRVQRYIVVRHGFNATLFLGDLFDGGYRYNDAEFNITRERFRKIFPLRGNERRITIPGNHDVGTGFWINEEASIRFGKLMAPLNSAHMLGGVMLVGVNSCALDHWSKYQDTDEEIESAERLHNAAWGFVEDAAKVDPCAPIVLATHIPLFRPRTATSCGPLRQSSNGIRFIWGRGYCTMLWPESSDRLLEALQPVLALSGDDHDHCEHLHEYRSGYSLREHTIGTVSWLQGNTRPSFGVLQLDQKRAAERTAACAGDSSQNKSRALGDGIATLVVCREALLRHPPSAPPALIARAARRVAADTLQSALLPWHAQRYRAR